MPARAAGFDADGAFSLVPASASSSASSSFKRTPSALTQLCAISLSDDAPFAPDANAHDLAPMCTGFPDADGVKSARAAED